MVYIELSEGIGNNLFQIAAGVSLAKENNTDCISCVPNIKTDAGESLTDYMVQYKDNILRNVSFMTGLPEKCTIYNQKEFDYKPIPYVSDILISGYFQSEKFFDKSYITELFSIDDKTRDYIFNKYGELLKDEIISIHVRRGDYLKRPLRQPICGMVYFREALKYFGKEKKYLVFSNDIKWCKKNFKGENFFFAENESSVTDLYLQSLCTHNIISNSSYSWWGAWLNSNPKKVVIAPDNWFGLQLKNNDTKDLIPEGWKIIRNPRSIKLKMQIAQYWVVDIFKRAMWRLFRIGI